jgi:hypothetical protein
MAYNKSKENIMKKIILLLFISSGLFADGLYSAGSFGYDWFGNEFKTSISVGYEFKGLYIEAEQVTEMTKADLYFFSPNRAEYYARAGFVFRKVYISWEHLCIHGIDRRVLDTGHDRFTIGFDTRLYEKNNHP